MKWVLLSLFMLNLMLAGMQWYKYRLQVKWPEYSGQEGVASLVLLNDRRQHVAVGSERCLLVGPFVSSSEAGAVKTVLESRSYQTEMVEQQLKKAPSFWVFDGPFDDELALAARYEEFKQKRIDSFIIRSGELANSISVGVFENIDSAKRMLSQMRGKGYRVNMRPITRHRYAFWLSVSGSGSSVPEAEIKQVFKGLKGVPETRQIFCKSVASPK